MAGTTRLALMVFATAIVCALPSGAQTRNERGKETRSRMATTPGAPALDISGAMSGIKRPHQVVVRTPRALAELWKEHAAHAPMPPVDFSKYDVVAVFAGSRNTGGYSVEIEAIRRTGRTAQVTAHIWGPGRGMMVTQAFTSPFAMRAVPKLPATVRFVVREAPRPEH